MPHGRRQAFEISDYHGFIIFNIVMIFNDFWSMFFYGKPQKVKLGIIIIG